MKTPSGLSPQGPRSTPENERAGQVLRWLDQWLRLVAAQANLNGPFRQARVAIGPLTRGNARAFPSGPVLSGFKVPITGTGDEAHGATRLEAVLTQVIAPLLEREVIPETCLRELQQHLRGELATLYRRLEQLERTARARRTS